MSENIDGCTIKKHQKAYRRDANKKSRKLRIALPLREVYNSVKNINGS
ncbi:hypothetical protein RBH29_08900 [Herbivorax sp. ANBcel31]|nr:hypothetical protein [Herbivorax sp. ANBcel31]MDQ2086541.1 hypothetical protein [Herbivorax sp. ANBcel31]